MCVIHLSRTQRELPNVVKCVKGSVCPNLVHEHQPVPLLMPSGYLYPVTPLRRLQFTVSLMGAARASYPVPRGSDNAAVTCPASLSQPCISRGHAVMNCHIHPWFRSRLSPLCRVWIFTALNQTKTARSCEGTLTPQLWQSHFDRFFFLQEALTQQQQRQAGRHAGKGRQWHCELCALLSPRPDCRANCWWTFCSVC